MHVLSASGFTSKRLLPTRGAKRGASTVVVRLLTHHA